MKNLKLFALAAAVLTMWSCGEKGPGTEPTPTDEGELTAPVLAAPAGAVVLAEADADETALSLSWTAASDEEGVSVGYEVYINASGKDIFTDPATVNAATALSKDLTHAELNTIALQLGADYGVATPFKAIVYAKHTNGDYDAVQSNEITVTVTPYMPMPDHLVALGASLNWGWNRPADTSAQLAEIAAGVYEAEGVEMRFAATDGFKLYFPTESTDSGFFAQDAAASEFGVMKYYKDGDTQFLPGSFDYANGVYTITADINTMEVTLVKTGDVSSFPDQLAIRGEALAALGENKWGWTDPKQILNPVSEGVYEISDVQIMMTSEAWQSFAFWGIVDGNGKDWPEYSQDPDGEFGDIKARVDSEPESRFLPFNAGYVSAIYTVRVDLNTMKLTLTKTEDLADNGKYILVAGDAMPWGWNRDGDARAKFYETEEGSNVFESTTDFNLGDEGGNGFKFWTDSGWDNEYLQDISGVAGKAIHKKDNTAGDTQFVPGTKAEFPSFGLSAGVQYKITIDMNNLMVTIVPAE